MGYMSYLEGLGIRLQRRLLGFASFLSLYVICKILCSALPLNTMMQLELTLVINVLMLEHQPNKFCIFNNLSKMLMDFLMRTMKVLKEICKDIIRASLQFLIYQKLFLFQ